MLPTISYTKMHEAAGISWHTFLAFDQPLIIIYISAILTGIKYISAILTEIKYFRYHKYVLTSRLYIFFTSKIYIYIYIYIY